MKEKAFSLLVITAVAMAATPLLAQSPTAFPYGGQLVLNQKRVDTGGRPGDYDFVFRAYDGPEAPTSRQIGSTIERPALPLTDGRFETRLDFGAAALQAPQLWIETLVSQRLPEGPKVVAKSRQELRINPSTTGEPTGAAATDATARSPNPVTNDAEILARLPGVRIVISDRQSPGQAHFRVDEASFRQAFGVGAPVTSTDLSAVGLVAASELRRELLGSQQRIRELEAELGRLRFRVHLTLLLMAVLIAGVFLQRQAATSMETASSAREPEPSSAEASSEQAAGQVERPGSVEGPEPIEGPEPVEETEPVEEPVPVEETEPAPASDSVEADEPAPSRPAE